METNEKSVFNEAVFQIQRLNELWMSCNKNVRAGNLEGYRWDLKCVQMELIGDAFRIEGTSIKDIEEGKEKSNKSYSFLQELDKNIEKSKSSKNEYYMALEKKHIYLRALQEAGGKGGNYVDLDADDME